MTSRCLCALKVSSCVFTLQNDSGVVEGDRGVRDLLSSWLYSLEASANINLSSFQSKIVNMHF